MNFKRFPLIIYSLTVLCCKPNIKPDNDVKIDTVKNNAITLNDTNLEDNAFLHYFDSLFTKKNTTLCIVYKRLANIEDSTIHVADLKYPDFGIKHSEYQEQLYKKEYKKFFKSLNLNDSMVYYINAFSLKYCK